MFCVNWIPFTPSGPVRTVSLPGRTASPALLRQGRAVLIGALALRALLAAGSPAAAETSVEGVASVSPLSRQQVTVSSGGMEGLSEVWVQAHVAGGGDWKDLVGLDEEAVTKKVVRQLRDAPGLSLAARAPNVARLQVIVVGHLIADEEGREATAATNLSMSLSQQVTVRRGGASRPILTTGATWQRSLLITGLKGTMGQRVNDKLEYLVDQFRQDYLRANPPAGAPASS